MLLLDVMERLKSGALFVSNLDTFPVFCAYTLMIIMAGQWKRLSNPLNLRPVLVVYNMTASGLSLYTLVRFIYGLLDCDSTFGTQPSEQLKPVFRIYWLTKIFELLDTVFMVLRHKSRQISMLHVYHHGSMLLLSDTVVHFYPCPAVAPYLGLNSAVHVVLYFYYGMCALYPNNPPEWKKFLTVFQILQFVIDLIHATIGYIFHTFCIYGIFYCISMIALFSNFYYQAYFRRRNTKGKLQ